MEVTSYVDELKTGPPSHTLLVISGFACETAAYGQTFSEHLYRNL